MSDKKLARLDVEHVDLAVSYDHPADGAKMVTNMSVDVQP